MRSSGNFSPEWGYLAPAPSFARTARVVLVATAIGATAGAGVVISLLDRPSEPDKAPVAARAIVTSVRTAAVPSVAPVVPAAATSQAVPANPAAQAASIATAPPPSDRPDNSARASTRRTPTAVRATKAATVKPAPATAPTAAPTTDTPSSPPAAAQVRSVGSAVDARAAVSTSTPAATAESVAAQSEPPKVVDAAPGDAADGTSIMAPEPAGPPKKTKHHAASKAGPAPGIGSFFKRMFAAHGSRSN